MEADRNPFDPAWVDLFFERGYFIAPGLFSPDEINALRDAMERLVEQAPRQTGDVRGAKFVIDGDAIKRVVWCGAPEPVLLEAGRDPRLLAIVARLLDSPDFDQLLNQAHFKLPNDGVHFPWHQDSERRRYGTPEWRDLNGRGSYVQSLLAIDDCDVDNGPMMMIPGSPKLGHLALGDRSEPEKLRLFDARSAEPAVMSAGSVLFFGPYTVHSSAPNRSLRPRRVLINGFAYPGANQRVYPGSGTGVRIHTG